jgi:hypothetical protein
MERNNLTIIVYLFGYQLEPCIKIWQFFLDYSNSFQILAIFSLQKIIELVIEIFQNFTPEKKKEKEAKTMT